MLWKVGGRELEGLEEPLKGGPYKGWGWSMEGGSRLLPTMS